MAALGRGHVALWPESQPVLVDYPGAACLGDGYRIVLAAAVDDQFFGREGDAIQAAGNIFCLVVGNDDEGERELRHGVNSSRRSADL